MLEEFRAPIPPIAVVERLPTSADQMLGALNEEELGLPASSLEDLLEWGRLLPLEPAMLLLARIAAALWHVPVDAEAQLQIIASMDMPNLLAAADAAIYRDRDGTRVVVFAEQYVTALQRVVVERAQPRRLDQGGSEAELRGVVAAYFAAATVVSSADTDLREGEPEPERWLTYLLKNGAYNTRPSLANVLTRYHELLDVLPDKFTDNPQFCDIRGWMSDSYGLTPIEQQAAGFYAYGMTNGLDADAPVNERSLIQHPFAASTLADRVDKVEGVLSAPREWYRDQFNGNGSDLDGIAWERRPFLQRPFLRTEDGRWILLFPRAIESWLGEGLHYRALDAAAEKGQTRRYNNFFGHLVERYCLDLARSAYPLDRLHGSGRAHPEQPYGRRDGLRTFDIAIDFGTDLLAIEVVAARLTAEMQVYSRPELLAKELEKMVFKKVRQIAAPVTAILAGDATIPDVDHRQIERVWPMIVTGGAMLITELLWDQVEAMLPLGLNAARVAPLTILDIDDFELLLAIGATGQHLPTVIRTWREGAYCKLDFAQFAYHEFGVDSALRLPIINERYEALAERMLAVLFPAI